MLPPRGRGGIVGIGRGDSCYFSATRQARATTHALFVRLDRRRWPRQARTHVQRRHRVAADGSAEQPDDDLRRADLSRARRARAPEADARRALPALRALSPAPGADRRRRVLGDRRRHSTSTHHVARVALPGRAGKAELQAFVQRAGRHAARSRAAAVAVPPVEQLRRRQRAGRAHPSLLRRRHRADPGDAVDDRRRSRRQWTAGPMPSAARARTRRPDDPLVAADRRRSTACSQFARQDRRDADRKRRRRSGRTRRGGRARRPGQRADGGDREARD